jgi:hypothetical protein
MTARRSIDASRILAGACHRQLIGNRVADHRQPPRKGCRSIGNRCRCIGNRQSRAAAGIATGLPMVADVRACARAVPYFS